MCARTETILLNEINLRLEANRLNDEGWFDPNGIEDARSRVLSSIIRRHGQPKFRQKLLDAYDGKCAVTDCDAAEALEAAHIIPFRGEETNCVRNGLLLRADIHTLFDRCLIAIDTSAYTVLVSRPIRHTVYGGLAGRPLQEPVSPENRPSTEALDIHRQRFESLQCGRESGAVAQLPNAHAHR